jgi:hypothetical protein
MRGLRCLFGASVCLLTVAAFGQKKTLETYLLKNADALREGHSLLYLDGSKISSADNTLLGFRRKVVSQGSLKVIVPTEMVFIDDSLRQKPDLYDGLDARTKALYLISTLTPGQIRTATTTGIGLGDLNSDQRAVLNSLIPKDFKVERRESGESNYKVIDTFTLSETQRSKVRFKLTRSISLDLPASQDHSYYPTDSMDHLGTQNLPGHARVEGDQESGPDELFGVKFRSIVPNKLKPSDLNYASEGLKKSISIASPISIADVLTLVQKATGITIYADPRVARRVVTLIGKDVLASDLLPAIAQMVTGTYRRVGSDYVLTSDLTGLGTKKLRLDQWQVDVEDYVEKMKPEWYKAVAEKKLLANVKSSPKDLVQTNQAFDEYLAKNDSQSDRKALPQELVDANILEFIQRFNKMYTSQPTSAKGIRAQSNLRYNFTLPNGEDVLERSGQIASFMVFNQTLRERPDYPMPKLDKALTVGSKASLGIRSSSPELVNGLVASAKGIGFKEIWLETLSEATLRAALEAGKAEGVGVRLVVRPWRLSTNSNGLDKTLLGDSAAQMRSWVSKNSRLSEARIGFDFMRTKPYPEDSVSPDQCPASWATINRLARMPGVVGVVVTDAQGAGYEPKVGEGYSFGTSPSDLAPRQFGYSISMRSAFLRETGADPIDLVPRGLRSSVNISPFFFPDMELMGYPRTYGSSDGEEFIIEPFVAQWEKFRAKAMTEGLKAFVGTALKDISVPIWTDLLVGTSNKASNHLVPLTDFGKDQQFQYDAGSPGMPFGAMAQSALAGRFIYDGLSEKDLGAFMAILSRGFGQQGERPFCYDVSRLSEPEVTKFLNTWFESKK